MNRRELLASFLGIPMAMSVGCSHSRRLPEQGEFVGPSHGAGHRLRDGFRPEPQADGWTDVDVVVVGGGIAGLTAARKLRQVGMDSVLLELESQAGGTSVCGESDLAKYPWGAHYLPVPLLPNEELIYLLDEAGLLDGYGEDGAPIVAEQHLCRVPTERLFLDGKWNAGLYPSNGASPEDHVDLIRFQAEIDRLVGWKDDDGRRAFSIPAISSSNDSDIMSLDRQTMAEWMNSQGLTSRRLQWYVDHACRDDYGLRADQTSAWAGLFYFAARVPEAGMPSQPFITWPEGNGRLVAHLAGIAGDAIKSGWCVSEIIPAPEKDSVQVVAFRNDEAPTPRCHGWNAKRVICATPPFLTPRLVRGYAESGPKGISDFEFGSWLVANLHLSNRPAEADYPLCWDNVLYDSPSLGYVVATHQLGRDYGPTVLTYYYPLCDDDPAVARQRLLSLSWEEWAEVILSDLERAHPEIRSLTERLDIMRWGHAMIRPTPGFVSGTSRQKCAEPFRGIHFAHSALSGIPLFEEAFYHGNRAAFEVIDNLHDRC